ncbi:MAG TPA: DHA2 family efflux MFS transporter permease subunit [Thermomicrobiales bacterium]|nr:MFS transporter [Chloroflexota bacterium]HQZ90529.1 DHA2 family efflux MFS transporter permease subunit [Thermomicrobiales bacterium]HRA32131.1 DHA2 family efflux MFS transporter permease subunit [Thermomicrobiales bacterium]
MSTTLPPRPEAMPAGVDVEPTRNPWLILVVLCTAVFMLLVDSTVVNVAQRKIQIGLETTLSEIQWVLDAYILAYAVLLLSFGRLGDVFGRKKLFIVGMTIFTAASALCGVSGWLGALVGISGVNALIFARVLQGVGGAFMMPQTLSLITVVFPADKRGAAMGIWGSIVSLGAVVGPVVGGLIVTHYAWEWIFLINVPVGIVAILATLAIVPESVDPHASRKIDWGGVLLSGLGIFAIVFALIEGNSMGWTNPVILGLFVGGLALLGAFVWWEHRASDPMMKLELFRLRNFSVGSAIAFVVAFGMLGIFFPMTLFLQGVLGYSPIRAGLTMMPTSLMIMVIAPMSGRLSDRIGARWILTGGLTLISVGILLIIASIDTSTTWQSLLPALIVTGAGMGMTFAPMTAAAMREVPTRIAGSASGILNTTRNVGQVMGIAVLGSLLQSWVGIYASKRLDTLPLDPAIHTRLVEAVKSSQFELVPQIVPPEQAALLPQIFHDIQLAFVSGIHNTFFVSAIVCACGAVTASLMRNEKNNKRDVVQVERVEAREQAEALAGD